LRTNVVDLEDILQVEKAAFTVIFFTVVICWFVKKPLSNLCSVKEKESLKNLLKMDITMEKLFIDILEVNKQRRELLCVCYLWDQWLGGITTSGRK
jgi:hypothetical protein